MLDYAYSKQYLRRLLVFLTYWGDDVSRRRFILRRETLYRSIFL